MKDEKYITIKQYHEQMNDDRKTLVKRTIEHRFKQFLQRKNRNGDRS